MKRTLHFLLGMIWWSTQLMAIPADPRPRYVEQADGTILSVRLCGDESYHFFTTMDGLIIVEDFDGGWYYADYDDIEGLRPSRIMAHNADSRDTAEVSYLTQCKMDGKTVELQQHVSQLWTEACRPKNIARQRKVTSRVLEGPGNYTGKKRGLVILAEFANLSMVSPNAYEEYADRFNKKGYTEDGHIGSVSDYFHDQSYGLFDLSFDVIGPVKLSRNYGYYGTDGTSERGHDLHADEMVREACRLADPFVDFKDYDWDHDGEADQVYVIYAGYGQATGGPDNTVWPHESHLEYYKDGVIELDGTIVNTYACSNELYGNSRTQYMGIGTACHEFSHCLGLPDTYDTDYSGAFGMSYWGVMNSGSYSGPNGRAEAPCGYTAFERWYAGWLPLKDIVASQWVRDLPDLETTPVAYRLRTENTPDEYYIFENRQGTKWFRYVSQIEGLHGMLVTHIDYDTKAWMQNNVNPSPSKQRMTIIPADGDYGETFNSMKGDLFPGPYEVTLINNTSHYETGGKLNHANADGTFTMNATLSDIEESAEDGTITFCAVLNRDLAIPEALDATWSQGGNLRFRWNYAFGASSYDVQITQVISTTPFQTSHQEIKYIRNNYIDLDITDYSSLLLRVRSRRGNLCSEWSNVVMADSVPEGIQSVIADSLYDTYYNTNGKPIGDGNHSGIVINGITRKKTLSLH